MSKRILYQQILYTEPSEVHLKQFILEVGNAVAAYQMHPWDAEQVIKRAQEYYKDHETK